MQFVYTPTHRESLHLLLSLSHNTHAAGKVSATAPWSIAWVITDSSYWATERQTASESPAACTATQTAENLLEELWRLSNNEEVDENK